MPKEIDGLQLRIYFSDFFDVSPAALRTEGAFDVSLINDLPLFMDPFLLFNSKRSDHQALHAEMIRYLRFLRDKAVSVELDDGLVTAWFTFPEVKQNWLGFSRVGNGGTGLGMKFARALHRNLNTLFGDFGQEPVTKSSHLEKLCLFDSGIGRDNISDFTTNLTKAYLLEYTQDIAKRHLRPEQRREVRVQKVKFSYETETWLSATYELPWLNDDFVVLTPRDLLTRDDNWINRRELLNGFSSVIAAVPDQQLRAQLNNYLQMHLPPRRREPPTADERKNAALSVLRSYPILFDYYIKSKEDGGTRAEILARGRVEETEEAFIRKVLDVAKTLQLNTRFYETPFDTLEETRQRLHFLKAVIEENDGYRLFWRKDGSPIRKEEDVQLLFRLTWFATTADVNREVNNGRGAVDYAISRGAGDKSLVEFKLASNNKLEQNLEHQVPIYEQANKTRKSIKAILYFDHAEYQKVSKILKRLNLESSSDVVLIDARRDNKPSASIAR